MNEAANLELIRNTYSAFARGDLDGLFAVQDVGIEIDSAGPREIPWAGAFRTINGARRYFGAIAAETELLAFEPRHFLAQGDHVIVLGFERIRSRRTGRTCENHW